MQGPGIFESPRGLSEKWPDFGNKVLNQQTILHDSPIFANWMQSRFLLGKVAGHQEAWRTRAALLETLATSEAWLQSIVDLGTPWMGNVGTLW